MMFYKVSPRFAAPPAPALTAVLFSAWVFLSTASAFADEVPKPAGARPVARLLSTSAQPAPARPRPRLLTATPFAPARPASATASAAPAGVSATGDEMRAFDLINSERRARGQKPLVWDGVLTRLARGHSANMARQNFFSHVDRDGESVRGRAEALGVRDWRALAENIAYNEGFKDPVGFAVERWMKSEKHRENILSNQHTHAGLGIARAADGRVFFTQVFMRR